MEVASGGSTGTEATTFTSAGGDLQLDASQSFQGLIAGFSSPSSVVEEIDLRDMPFEKSTHVNFKEAKDGLSGTLTIKDGPLTAMLTLLGNYSKADFTLSSDGHGGTIVTDPTHSVANMAPFGQHTASFAAASIGQDGTPLTNPLSNPESWPSG